MSYRGFSSITMIGITNPLLHTANDKSLLESHQLTRGLVPYLRQAHNELLQLQDLPTDVEIKARELTEKAGELDGLYNDRYRSFYSILSGLAAVTPNDIRRYKLKRMRDALMPEGLNCGQSSFLEESQRVEVAVSRLTPDMKKMLQETVVMEKSLYHIFSEWVDAGRRLGEVERQRVRLGESDPIASETLTKVQNARHQWLRVMNALVSIVQLDSEYVPEQLRTDILQPLRTAESNHARTFSETSADDMIHASSEGAGKA